MIRMLHALYGFDCRLFQKVNSHFDKKLINIFFRSVTHLGGADMTIPAALLLIFLSSGEARLTAFASALALTASHIPVQLVKQLFPRKRPYLMLEQTRTLKNPLQDHSFPSGHTTAIFSILTPYLFFMPQLSPVLLLAGILVGISRIYLGLHYPSDVMVGGLLGFATGCLSFWILCV